MTYPEKLQPIADQFGLTRYDLWTDTTPGGNLKAQLAEAGIEFERTPVPNVIGMGGSAIIYTYTSPTTGEPLTVFVVPVQFAIDAIAEDYYYFHGLAREDALARDWGAVYEAIRDMR